MTFVLLDRVVVQLKMLSTGEDKATPWLDLRKHARAIRTAPAGHRCGKLSRRRSPAAPSDSCYQAVEWVSWCRSASPAPAAG